MADPASLAGTAIGVVSLGIQVTQGLVKYYKAWAGQKAEINDILSNLEHERDILGLLQVRLNEVPQEHALEVQRVEDSIVRAEHKFRGLDNILQRCKQTPASTDVKDCARNAVRSVLYPFKQDTIRDLRVHVGEVGRILALAIEILQL